MVVMVFGVRFCALLVSRVASGFSPGGRAELWLPQLLPACTGPCLRTLRLQEVGLAALLPSLPSAHEFVGRFSSVHHMVF